MRLATLFKAPAPSPSGPGSATFRRLASLDARELYREFLRGQRPDKDDLAGWEFRGLNHARATELLGIRKFVKGFYRSDDDLYGYNLKIRQTSVFEEWQGVPDDNTPIRHGFYRVRDVDPTGTDNAHLHALLLDYGQGDNPRFDVTRGLRDYLVQVDADVYLGVAMYAFGSKRLPLPGCFLLDRFRRGVVAA